MTTYRRHPGWLVAASGLAALWCSTSASSQQRIEPGQPVLIQPSVDEAVDASEDESAEVEIPGELEAIVDRLDAPDFIAREQALDELVAFDPDIKQMRTLLRREAISLEQRHRLLTAAWAQLVDRPRGALGIRMRWHQERVGEPGEIEVLELLPDLPARHVLRIGDRITHVDGMDLREQQDLLRFAQSRLPGERIGLSIRRVERDELGNAQRNERGELIYQQLELELVLGSAEKLLDQNGFVQQAGPVIEQRQGQALRLAINFGTRARQLELDADSRVDRTDEAFINPVPTRHTELVDQHRYVKAIEREKRLIEEGRLNRNRMVRIWQERIIDLQRQLTDDSLSARDRRHLREVMARCMELIAQ